MAAQEKIPQSLDPKTLPLRRPSSSLQPPAVLGSMSTTALVKALLAFGDEPSSGRPPRQGELNPSVPRASAAESELGEEEAEEEVDDVVVRGSRVHTREKGKGKEKDAVSLDSLKLDSTSPADEPSRPSKMGARDLKRLLRSSEHKIQVVGENGETETRVLTSWKMQDFAYKRDPCPYPTLARGLFTEAVTNPGKDGEEYRIVARGYDKFFNVGEVSWTKWETIPLHASGPFELTQKSNGCIIFIAALSPIDILVTSKHSIGALIIGTTESGQSHSQRGEYWLDIHLAKVGKTKRDLAAELWARELTAVAELCDDEFEEHVLAYPSDLTGLHLHGLNRNTAVLQTLPSSDVQSFASKWGFISTPYIIFPSVPALRTYCATVEADGGVLDEKTNRIIPIEGFVVRGHKKGGQKGEAFFWKVKYDEPYLMYREWRELTRKLLSSHWHPQKEQVVIKPGKLRNEESRLYLWWVDREIKKDLSKFEAWRVGKGIIKTREEFVAWSKTDEARKARIDLKLKTVEEEQELKDQKFEKTLIVPIAIPGCGKTALGLSLSKLFGWGHTQSDDFAMKKAAPHFLKSVRTLFDTHDVVYADKNNHVIALRSDLVKIATGATSKHRIRLVAFVWPLDSPTLPRDKLHSLCASRIVQRGDNHQSLRAGPEHESTIWGFIKQYEEFDQSINETDGRFHHVLTMRPELGREESLRATARELVEILGLEMPSEDRIREALEFAKEYRTTVVKVVGGAGTSKAKSGPPRYYGIKVQQDLEELLSPLFLSSTEGKEEDQELATGTEFFNALLASHRLERNPHITLVHEAEVAPELPESEEKALHVALWDLYASLVSPATTSSTNPDPVPTPSSTDAVSPAVLVQLTLGPLIVWDSRVMAIQVTSLVPDEASSKIALPLAPDRSETAHVTVGTRESSIRPFEGKLLLEAYSTGETESKEGGKIFAARLEGDGKTCRGRLMGMR